MRILEDILCTLSRREVGIDQLCMCAGTVGIERRCSNAALHDLGNIVTVFDYANSIVPCYSECLEFV